MTPEQVKVMDAYFEASRSVADAADYLIQAASCGGDCAGMPCTCAQFEEVAKIRLAAYRQASADYEAL